MSNCNINSVEEGITIGTTNDNVQPAQSQKGRMRNIKVFVSVAVMVMAIVAAAVALSTGKKQEVDRDANSSLIVGGTEAIEGRFPYIVSFRNPLILSETWCGGSLIAKDVVLTAAHCDTNPGEWPTFNDYVAVVGRHASSGDDGEEIGVKSRLPHPDFIFTDADVLDVMLVFLDHAYTANNVDLVALNSDTSLPFVGQEVKVMGWGTTTYMGSSSDVLQQVDLKVISDEKCSLTEASSLDGQDYFNFQDNITNWEYALCAVGANGNGKDTCDGDSGGPLVVSGGNGGADIQVGVVSWGIDCGRPGIPGIYSQISTAYDWIRDEVCKGSVYATEAGFDCSNVDTTPSSSFVTNIPTSSPTEGGTQGVTESIVTKSPTYAPTYGSTPTVPFLATRICLTQQECFNRYQELAESEFESYHNFYVGNFGDNYGCFSKGGNVYWGEGGTEEQLWDHEFTGKKSVVFCRCGETDDFC